MTHLFHPDGPASPAAIEAERMAEAIADAVATETERLRALLTDACTRLEATSRRIHADAARIGPMVAPGVLETHTLGDIRTELDSVAEYLTATAAEMWTGEDALADYFDEVR